ncbi:MAG TPA: AarF/ABC1/UbiB kinase family protein [Candidatus Competibacteraceae bacterium]|nr:AarF/ABC1/UbiB kinase family protein [Candidatus Competibacteraceae bacterium]HQA26551.1 AarF/ABC1/UbiB kinase family protein [Candidatus Competibacteraceae bacterium]HQD55095.1 AarF/ABC1/UbiB kinase family protein [Candidatus Competibacteraceae bacterium]
MSKSNQRNTLHQVQTNALLRGLGLTSAGMRMSARLGFYSLENMFVFGEQRHAQRRQMLAEQARILVDELGQLKGSVMKMGQILALYGDYFLLPPEVVDVLRTLQDDSPPLAWPALEAVLYAELGADRLNELEVDREPLAAASLGQVHRALRRSDGRELCIKIQYPGVAESIDSDLNSIGALLLFSNLLPTSFISLPELMSEVREMLHREVDYRQELDAVRHFRRLLADDDRYRVPEPFPEYSTQRVLTLSYEPGMTVDGPEVQALSQARRNRLAEAGLDLFLREFFEWGLVQTDPHFGNYRVQLDPNQGQDRLVLLDFGAVQQFSPTFLHAYHAMVRAAFRHDKTPLRQAVVALGFLPASASTLTLDRVADMCFLIVEPFEDPRSPGAGLPWRNERGEYRWGASDLPQRVALAASRASLSLSFRLPPREFLFLHRKLGGVFVFAAELDAELVARPLLQRYMHEPSGDSPAAPHSTLTPATNPALQDRGASGLQPLQ